MREARIIVVQKRRVGPGRSVLPPHQAAISKARELGWIVVRLQRRQLHSSHFLFGRDFAEVTPRFRVGFLAVLRVGFFAPVAALVVFRFDFFVDGFFATAVFLAFFGDCFFFGDTAAGFALRFGAVDRFLAAPIAAPDSAPITVPTTGTPKAVPATAPATAPPRALPVVPVGLSAVFSFLSSSMFFTPSWRQDARPREPTCQRAPSLYSLARAGILERCLVVVPVLGASRLGSDCAAFPCPWRPPSGSFGK